MAPRIVSEFCREVMVALPDTGGDIYRQHQHVWKAMHGDFRHGREFVYSMLSPHLALVRSTRLSRGVTSVLPEHSMKATLVTAAQTPAGLRRLDRDEARGMVASLLHRHGIMAARIEISSQRMATGCKVDRVTGRRHVIAVPISDVIFDARVHQPALAQLAWRDGIGRGKRFGFGMLQKV